jgi:hypothetical protein
LETYGQAWPIEAPKLQDFHSKHGFLQSTQVTAWVCLASSTRRPWLLAMDGKT